MKKKICIFKKNQLYNAANNNKTKLQKSERLLFYMYKLLEKFRYVSERKYIRDYQKCLMESCGISVEEDFKKYKHMTYMLFSMRQDQKIKTHNLGIYILQNVINCYRNLRKIW